jgi:hypothetical protein
MILVGVLVGTQHFPTSNMTQIRAIKPRHQSASWESRQVNMRSSVGQMINIANFMNIIFDF